jgi:hypothetical protein
MVKSKPMIRTPRSGLGETLFSHSRAGPKSSTCHETLRRIGAIGNGRGTTSTKSIRVRRRDYGLPVEILA